MEAKHEVEMAGRLFDDVKEGFGHAREKLDDGIRQHPEGSVIAATVAGIAIGAIAAYGIMHKK